jgi:hypothetical protein
MDNNFNETGTCCEKAYWIVAKSHNEFSSADVLPDQLCYNLSKIRWEDPAVIRKLEAIVASQSKSLKLDTKKQTIFDLDSGVNEYRELIEAIKRQISDPAMAAVVLQEIRKDMRSSEIREKSYHSSPYSLPQTSAQRVQLPQNVLTKEQVAKLIDAIVNSLRNS